MVSLNISNVKLLYRAIGLIESITGVDSITARATLLHAIYGEAYLEEDLDEKDEALALLNMAHVRQAQPLSGVIPVALLMAWQG